MKSSGKLLAIVLACVAGVVLLWLLVRTVAAPPTMAEILPPGIPVEGPASSTVTITEFLDFQCPSCAAFHPVMKSLREEYAGRIRFAQRQFPLVEIHQYAKGAAIAAVCADKQGKYFEYADALISNQAHLERADLVRYAEALKLDAAVFQTCLDDQSVADFVVKEREAGQKMGIKGTPWIFVNDEALSYTPTYDQLKKLIDEGLAGS